MKYLGVIGYPLEHSLSPAFQQAALDHLQLDIDYEAWPTATDGLATRVNGLRAPAVVGANVTIPHKQAVIPMLDELDDVATRISAANTIVNREGRLRGSNTDGEGFMRALREDGRCDPAGQRALVVGAGGSARAIIVALIDAGVESITVINRTFERALSLVAQLRATTDIPLGAMPDQRESWEYTMRHDSLLINCTPPTEDGEIFVPTEMIRSEQLIYDLVYRPEETPLMESARQRGARVLGGLPMLIYQGAASFKMWTGREAPVDIMFKAAREALAGSPVGRDR